MKTVVADFLNLHSGTTVTALPGVQGLKLQINSRLAHIELKSRTFKISGKCSSSTERLVCRGPCKNVDKLTSRDSRLPSRILYLKGKARRKSSFWVANGGLEGPLASVDVRAYGEDIPTQGDTLSGVRSATVLQEFKPERVPDLDYLQELLAIQQSGPKNIGFFGTRNMGYMHQQLIEILSYAMVITGNHIFTSGSSGTNSAVIRGALRAEKPELLTVILPQSLRKQPPESQELLSKVSHVIEMPDNDNLPLLEASRLCNMDIIAQVQQVICFAFHDSKLLMETCREAKSMRKIVTLFYLD